jgi:hypothetical protein
MHKVLFVKSCNVPFYSQLFKKLLFVANEVTSLHTCWPPNEPKSDFGMTFIASNFVTFEIIGCHLMHTKKEWHR